MLHALRTSISRSDLSHHPGLGSNHRTLLDILAILVCIALKYRSNQRNKQNPLFFCVSVSLRYSEPVTNHTGRINLQVQSSYKSKISQKYASLLYIANVYLYLFCFSRASKTYVTEHNHTSPLSTVDVFITELRNRLENRSCVTFFFCPFFLFCNTTPTSWFFSSPSSHVFLIPLLRYFTTRWSQSVNIETERVALLQTCGSTEPPTAS